MGTGQITEGKRVRFDHIAEADRPSGAGVMFAPGEYGRHPLGNVWMACTPNGHLGNLANHTVIEHEDGTITVSPSILVVGTKDEALWHGFLEHGVWREI
ncbi:MAG: hypothetical protein IMZ54_02410 [Acidobacteria bacterium]|nr:hypothetical protein [Spirochaetota bacterium]MBE3129555.1 hypothetical protein [Acidobacteriota bacterium]